MANHVLVVFPHPDDESFGVSGTIATHINEGTPVTYICLTLGEMGRNMGKPFFANRETLPIIRKQELEDACQALGIQDLRRFGLRDKTVEFENQEELAGRITAVIQEVQPSLIITFYPGYSVHPDHDACGAAVVRAVQGLPRESRPEVHCIAFARNAVEELGEPDRVCDVRGVLAKKVSAIRAHRTQTENMMTEMADKLAVKDPEAMRRFGQERFWKYKFD